MPKIIKLHNDSKMPQEDSDSSVRQRLRQQKQNGNTVGDDEVPLADATEDAAASSEVPPQKSLLIAYMLYFIGGPWGLHHLYLDRPDHCFLWLTTFGGFGFGSMRDVWRIPSYVRAANFDAKHMRDYDAKLKYNAARGVHGADSIFENFASFNGMWMVGMFFRYILINALPRVGRTEEYPVPYALVAAAVAPVGLAIGIVIAGSLPFGMQGSWRQAFIGALVAEATVGQIVVALGLSNPIPTTDPTDPGFEGGLFPAVIAAIWFVRSRRYLSMAQLVERESDPSMFRGGAATGGTGPAAPPPTAVTKEGGVAADTSSSTAEVTVVAVGAKALRARASLRASRWPRYPSGWNVVRVAFFVSVFWSTAFVGVYHNVRVTTDGEDITIREVANNFFASPAWAHSKTILRGLPTKWWNHGFSSVKDELIDSFDLDGKKRAYHDLELEEDASQDEVKQAARRLQKLYHPDRCALPDPEECVSKFQDVQEARNRLLKTRSRRD